MATTRSFQDMLNQYLPDSLFAEELLQRDYVLKTIPKINDWKGGTMVVPFRGAQASSLAFGELTASNDVSESTYVRGTISGYKELWGTMSFNHRDLVEHDGKIPDTTFLRLIPDELERFMQLFKEAVSTNICNGAAFAKATGNGGADGTITVDHIDRFQIGQKVVLDDDDSNTQVCYITAIDVNGNDLTVSATRGGGALDISAYTTAQNAKFYHPGGTSNSTAFLSFRDILLPSAEGGASTVHGQTKATYPALQAVAVSGADINSTNLLDKLFDFYTTARSKAKGRAGEILMSYKHLGTIFKLLETQKGAFRVVEDPKASLYGWTEVTIGTVKGNLKIVALLEMDDDVIYYIDWASWKFCTNGFVRKRVGPNGTTYFESRSSSGYTYLIDVMLFGELRADMPGHNGVLYDISY